MASRVRLNRGVFQVQFVPGVDSGLLKKFVALGESRDFLRGQKQSRLERHETLEFLADIGATAKFAFRGNLEADDLTPRLDHVLEFKVGGGSDLCAVVANIRQMRDVECAAYVPPLTPPLDDELIGKSDVPVQIGSVNTQWYLYRCNVLQAWELLRNSSAADIVVADLDWGFFVAHPELKQRIGLSYNAIDGSQNVSVGNLKHGTGALGLIGAPRDGRGMVGFAPRATLWAIQAGEVQTTTEVSYWADAINYVTRLRGGQPTVINIEAETASHRRIDQICSIRIAIQRAIKMGIVVCVPAGNGNVDARIDDCGTVFPTSGAIVVGASSLEDCRYTDQAPSNFGRGVDVCAPGHVGYDTTCAPQLQNPYTSNYGGTSSASAKVAGAVALVLQANRSLNPNAVATILKSTGVPISLDRPVGSRIDCWAAVKRAQSMTRA